MILLLTLMSIVGAVCVSDGKALTANYIWAVSNMGFVWYNISISEYEMTLLFGVYELVALYGIYNLRLKKHAQKPEAI
jgi:hypothetical protein